MLKRSLKWSLLLLALVWVLAACGGTDAPEPGPNNPDPGPTEPNPVTPEAPTNLNVADSEDGAVLTWEYTGEGDASFTVYRRDAETEEPETPTDNPEDAGQMTLTPQQVPGFEELTTTTETTYTDSGAAADDYEYAVTATVDEQESEAVTTETPEGPGTDPTGPADIIVTSTDDEGVGTLRAAIADAADGNIIEIGPDVAGGTITFTGSATIDKNLTIRNAAGADNTVISGGDATSLFYIPGAGEPSAPEEAINITLQGITLTEGAQLRDGAVSGVGGAIYNGQNLTLIDTIVSDSVATSGGGIYTTPASTLILRGATSVTGNTAEADGEGEGGVGGGINVGGSLTIEPGVTVTNNTAGSFGGVHISTGATFTGDATGVTGNTPTDIGGPGFTPTPGDTPEEPGNGPA